MQQAKPPMTDSGLTLPELAMTTWEVYRKASDPQTRRCLARWHDLPPKDQDKWLALANASEFFEECQGKKFDDIIPMAMKIAGIPIAENVAMGAALRHLTFLLCTERRYNDPQVLEAEENTWIDWAEDRRKKSGSFFVRKAE